MHFAFNTLVADLEARIDDLYRGSLDEFIPARSALAAGLKGPDQQRVKQLRKPTAVPWAVNQVYWHARAVFDRAARTGADLRRAQIQALEGRSTDVRTASEAHRTAIATAVAQAVRFAEIGHLTPDRDALARTFEALTLTPAPPTPAGRLTGALQPGGFEMLAGIPVSGKHGPSAGAAAAPAPKKPTGSQRDERAAARERERLAAEARKRAAELKRAEADLSRARDQEAEANRHWDAIREELERAKKAWEQARERVQKAERTLADLRSSD